MAAVLAAGGCFGGTSASGHPASELKTAFVLNFLRFAEWPAQRFAGREAGLLLCVWPGDVRMLQALGHLAGRSVDERALRLEEIERPEDLVRCHALFVPETARGLPPQLLHRAEVLDVLTIGDADGFAAGGGMIGLVMEGARMRFEINDRCVRRSAIRLGAQLYQLGRLVPGACR